MFRRTRGEQGFTLIEVMIASALTTVLMGSLASLMIDYSEFYKEARQKNVLIALRRTILRDLNRRDSWAVTYQSNASFACFLNPSAGVGTCPAGPQSLVVYGGSTYPAPSSAIVFSSINPNQGFTLDGIPCSTFNKTGTSGAARQCPIRLELTWVRKSFGIPSTTVPPAPETHHPTGLFPYGYYVNHPSGNQYLPSTYGTHWWFGTTPAQVEISGTFILNESLGLKINTAGYDFKIVKEVP